ncbi:MAG: gliding motility-associated C-terminal domain-containing protein, partial [Crocinitomicaceae bacterium]|nr:gliding motility-associated C-terminal domain-containing protein [Crocinitomicaceae bacterium]
NNDGSNDFFTIEMSEKLDFQIVVIDQTNTVVFQSNDRNFRWDGTMMSGEPAPSGDYVYFLSAKTMGGKDFVKSSKLRIQR